mmetsp:Transcript_24619/g.58133  ORF Transcript_24619/g.58133 Transcript_24619/m.58133 type:complete len:216 (-) Transcript_24619:25-672(-)
MLTYLRPREHVTTYADLSQVFSDYSFVLFPQLFSMFIRRDDQGIKTFGVQWLALIDELDTVLSSNKHFLLGKWLHSARSWAADDSPADFYERNARDLVTVWGNNGVLNDYASKMWGGLCRTYYRQRWKIFFDMLSSSRADEDFKSFSTEVSDAILAFETKWQTMPLDISPVPVGDSIKTATAAYKQYGEAITKAQDAISGDAWAVVQDMRQMMQG